MFQQAIHVASKQVLGSDSHCIYIMTTNCHKLQKKLLNKKKLQTANALSFAFKVYLLCKNSIFIKQV